MKTITKYIADDGVEFASQEECKTYEKNKWFLSIWEGTEENDYDDAASCTINTFDGAEVLAFLSKRCIITEKPEAPSAEKVLNKGKNN